MYLYGEKLFQKRNGISCPTKSGIEQIKVDSRKNRHILYFLYLLTDFKVDKERFHEKKWKC